MLENYNIMSLCVVGASSWIIDHHQLRVVSTRSDTREQIDANTSFNVINGSDCKKH